MSSLEGCIKKAGKALRKDDADAIRKIRDDMLATGIWGREVGLDVNQAAVDEYIQILDEEREEVLRQAEKKGGLLADKSLSPSEFSKQVAQRIEDRARDFPKVGLQRGRPKGNRLDLHLMRLTDLHSVLEILDPDMAAAVLEENGGMAGLKALHNKTGEWSLREIYMEHIEPLLDEKRKLKLFYSAGNITIDPFMEELVNKHPKSPASVLHKQGAAMEAVAEQSALPPEGLRGLLERITKGKTSQPSKAGILNLMPQTKLPDVIRNGMDSAKHYVKGIKDMSAYMERLMEGHATLGKTWLTFNKNFQKGAKLLGELMHAATLAGVDMANFQMPSADDMKKMSKKQRAVWAKRQEDYEILLPFWEKLGRIGSKVDYEEAIYQPGTVEPDGTTKEGKLKTIRKHNVPEGHAIYMGVRDTYRNMRRRGIQGLENRVTNAENDMQLRRAKITGLRQLFESGKINPYFPLSRFGQYAAVAKDPETDEVVGFFKRENRAERNRLVDNLIKMGYRAYPIDEVDSDAKMVKRIDPNFVAKVVEIVGEDAEVEGSPGTSLQDEIWQMYLRALPEMSIRKAFIHRTGRLGFSHDALRAFGDHTFHGTHQMAKLKYGYQLQNDLVNAEEEAKDLLGRESLIQNLRAGMNPPGHKGETPHQVLTAKIPEYTDLYEAALAKNPKNDNIVDEVMDVLEKNAQHDGPWAMPLYDNLAKRHEYNMNPKSAAWATNMTALGFLWFLSSSPAAGFLNLTQTAISAYPVMRARFAGAGAGMELLKASKQYATSGEMRGGTFGSQLRNDEVKHSDGTTKQSEDIGERSAFDYFREVGMFAKTRTRDLMGLAERGMHQNDAIANTMEYAGWIFHKTEEANRMVTALAAYRLARKKFSNLSPAEAHTKAVEMADEIVEMSHYDYTNTNRPPLMQGDKGRVVFLFRNYSLNMQYRLIRDFKDGIWKNDNISKEDRVEARRRFAGIITMTSLFAGMSGWPLISAVHSMLDMFLGDDDDPFDSRTEFRVLLAEMWGEKVGEAIYKGPWDAFTGASISGRASLNNLWIREVPESLRGQDLLLHLAGEGLGPVFGIGMNFMQGFQDIQEDHAWRGMEKLVPKFVSDWSKTLRYATQGAQNRQLDMILPPESFGNADLLAQFMGFSPSEVTKQYEQNRAVKDMESKLRRRHDQLINRLFMSYKLEDRKGARETLRDITHWNKANPSYPITPSTLKQSAKSRAQYDMRTVGGIALDKRLNYLHETLRFTERK